MISCGVSQIDITPLLGVRLAGYGNRTDSSTAVHDPLYAQVLYLRDVRQTEVALISLDLVGIDREFTSQVRLAIEAKTLIPKENIMVACTHTHAGPDGFAILFPRITPPDKNYQFLRNEAIGKIVTAVQQAKLNVKEAKFWYGIEKVEGVCTNRNDPKISIPNTLTTLRIENGTDLIGLIVSYGCHPTVLSAKNLLISADFPGALRVNLQKNLGSSVSIFLNSGSGDVSTRFTRQGQDFDEVERIGRLLAGYALEANRKSIAVTVDELSTICKKVSLPLRKFPSVTDSEKLVQELEHEQESLRNQSASVASLRVLETKIMGAKVQAKFSRELTGIDEMTTELQGIRIGDLVLISIPGEPFTEIVEIIKRGSNPYKTIVISYANDYMGYFPIGVEEDTYESLKSPWSSEIGELLAEQSLNVINELTHQIY